MPKITHSTDTSVTVLGITYSTDANGIIDIPDDQFSTSVYQKGWVSAKAKLAQLARQTVPPVLPADTPPQVAPAEIAAPEVTAAEPAPKTTKGTKQ